MAYEYYVNGERADIKMDENDDKKLTKQHRQKQISNYHTATAIQVILGVMAFGSFLASQHGLWTGDNWKWFTRNAVTLMCLGFIGVISAVKSLFKHEISDDKDNK